MSAAATPTPWPGWLRESQNRLLPLVLFISLLAVAGLNALVQFRGRRIEKQIAAMRPAREYTRKAQLAIALEMSALHTYALTHRDTDIARYQIALRAEQQALSAIRPGQRGLPPELAAKVAAVQALTMRWRDLVLLVDRRPNQARSNSSGARVVAEQDMFRQLMDQTGQLDEAIASTMRQRQLEIDNLAQLDSRSTVLLCLIALLAAAGMLWLSHRVQQLAVEAEQRRREIERVMSEKAHLTRGLSHDLRNPLGSIQGYAQLIEDSLGARATDRQKQMFERLQRAVETCLAILRDVVDLSRAEVGSLSLEIAPVDIGKLLTDVVADARSDADIAQLRLHLDLPARLPTLETDGRRAQQILGNLLSNAIKYTPPGGDVYVRTSMTDTRWLIFGVSDTGPGIPESEREKIFQEFYRMNGSSRRAAGFGVGLAISRRLARLMGGDITVNGGPEGSTFSLRLPLRSEA